MAKKLSPITPGDVLLEEFLKPMEITQNQLARDINVPANRVSQIIHGKREITADTALRLGKYFGIEPEFWLNLQVRYNMKIARNKVGKKIEKEVKDSFFSIQNTQPCNCIIYNGKPNKSLHQTPISMALVSSSVQEI